MKQLSDTDLEFMANTEFCPDEQQVKRQVRTELKLSQLIPQNFPKNTEHIIIDFHNKTEEQAWTEILKTIHSGTKQATVITGASGILKIKFQQWATDSAISQYIKTFTPINNGSFNVIFNIKNPIDK